MPHRAPREICTRPSRTNLRFSSCSGTMLAMVASATKSRSDSNGTPAWPYRSSYACATSCRPIQRNRAPELGITRAGAVWIHNGYGRRHLLIGLMMVGHDYVHSQLVRQCHLRCDVVPQSDVTSNEMPSSCNRCTAPRFRPYPSRFRCGTYPRTLAPRDPKKRQVQARRRHPINIIIAIETDLLVGQHGSMQSLNRLLISGIKNGSCGTW